ncbi:MAG: hypothetical protein KDK07_00685 [Bauldia sp.]|nr:hypothetical protein [Bauldia sp.]
MVVFAAKNLPVDNSDLSELNGYKPLSSSVSASLGYASVYKDGLLSVTVFVDDQMKYRVAKIEVPKKELNKLFNDGFEPKLFKGSDTIKGSTSGDMLYGFDGGDAIKGRGGNDSIYGGKGSDAIYGGNGINTLNGGGGKDAFVFDSALMPGNNSHVADFKSSKDTMQLDRTVFDGIGDKGTLKGSKFFTADKYAGQKKAVIYDKDVGTLSYSKDGGDLSNAVNFGSVTAGLDISHKDFLIV